jgi:hypothetical protein
MAREVVLGDSRPAGMRNARTAPTSGGVRTARFTGSADGHTHTDSGPHIDAHEHCDATTHCHPHSHSDTISHTDFNATGTSGGGRDPSRALKVPAG